MVHFSCPEPYCLLITCEHGGNLIPDAHKHLFSGCTSILNSHRAYDPGALDLARILAGSFKAELISTSVSRLLIDCNRSVTNRNLFSNYSRVASQKERKQILNAWYLPHREAVYNKVDRILQTGSVLVHVAVHSFVAELAGKVRNADIGLLYDPARGPEKQLCAAWKKELLKEEPSLRVRKNYPYLGKTDGLPTMLRKKFPEKFYLGIELEISQGTYLGTMGASLDRILPAALSAALLSLAA